MNKPVCIDLFCGAGGLTHGFILEGINVIAGIDLDDTCKFPFEKNNKGAKFISADISEIKVDYINQLFKLQSPRILAGCAPCQPFSTYSQKYKTSRSNQWKLLNEFGRLIKGVVPEIVTMENVPKLKRHSVFNEFLTLLKEQGYSSIWHDIVDCSSYGLPQKRKRLVLLASRIGNIELIPPKIVKQTTVKQAIGNLPQIEAGSTHAVDVLHTSSQLKEINLKRIQASKPGGTWRDWPEYLIANCHKKKTGKTYPAVYGRMSWDEPAPTLTTQFFGFGNGRFGHPSQDRAISLREGAILQGFPKSYKFVKRGDVISFGALGRMIGNAVPVTLSKVIASSILKHLQNIH